MITCLFMLHVSSFKITFDELESSKALHSAGPLFLDLPDDVCSGTLRLCLGALKGELRKWKSLGQPESTMTLSIKRPGTCLSHEPPGLSTRSKKLLGTKGITTRSKDATSTVAPGLTTSNKKLQGSTRNTKLLQPRESRDFRDSDGSHALV